MNHDEQSITVVLVGGLPGAGKSHLCRDLTERLNARHIEYDALEEELDQGDPIDMWRQARTSALQQLQECLETNENTLVILDDNFYLRSMRKQVYQVCQPFATTKRLFFATLWIDTKLEACLERNQQRTRAIDSSVIVKMARNAEPPVSDGLYHWDAGSRQLDGVSLDLFDEALSFIKQLSTQPHCRVRPIVDESMEQARLERERAVTAASTRHAVDQQLRVCVRRVVESLQRRNCEKERLGQVAAAANRVRQTLLKADGRAESTPTADDFMGKLWLELGEVLDLEEKEAISRALDGLDG